MEDRSKPEKRPLSSPIQENPEDNKRINLNTSDTMLSGDSVSTGENAFNSLLESPIEHIVNQQSIPNQGQACNSAESVNTNSMVHQQGGATNISSGGYSPSNFDLGSPSFTCQKTELNLPSDTPEWAKTVFKQVWNKLLESDANSANSIHIGNCAMAENGVTATAVKKLEEKMSNTVESLCCALVQSNNENKKLKEKVVRLESYSRKDNLLVSGVPEKRFERDIDCRRKCLNLFRNTMGIDTTNMWIVRCHRVGRYSKNQKYPRKIVIRFHYYGDRDLVWANRRLLHGTNYFLDEDFPGEIVKRRKQLWSAYQAARKHPDYKGKCSLVEDRLLLNGRYYSMHELNQLPDPINPWLMSQKFDDKTVAFFTKNSPFSNHYPQPVRMDCVEYNCNEQYIMKEKASIFGDFEAEQRIMAADDPVQQKAIGRQVKDFNYERWKQESPRIAYEVCLEKFSSNRVLANWLLATGNKTIVEASPDKLWGVGMKLNNPDILKPEAWGDSVNCMGKALMKVREVICKMREKNTNSLLHPEDPPKQSSETTQGHDT